MPAQDKVGNRLALIVACSDYQDPTLRQLRAPGHDASDLAEVLRNPAIGMFDVQTFMNSPSNQLLRGIVQFCHLADPGDLVLIYLSCHGVLDSRGRLYYATADTERALLSATAVSAQWLSDQLDDCRARRQILLLDCCHSGAFAKGSKGDDALALKNRFSGGGKVVLTASGATEYSFEGTTVVGEGVRSVFTHAVVDGLRTGLADRDRDGLVTVDDLYHHVFDAVRTAEPRQTPEIWTFGAKGHLLIAHSPRGPVVDPVPLPDDVRLLIESSRPVVREAGVKVLADLINKGEPGLALTARLTLQRISEEDLRHIATVARAALDAGQGQAVKQTKTRHGARLEAKEQGRDQSAAQAPTAETEVATPLPKPVSERLLPTWAGAYQDPEVAETSQVTSKSQPSVTATSQMLVNPLIPPEIGLLPSVDRRPTSRMPLPAKAMRIGRANDNDVALPDMSVSRHHVELRKSLAGTYEVVDLGSYNGTFVNGQRVNNRQVAERDLVAIGRTTFRLKGGELSQFIDEGNVSFTVQDVVVKAPDGKVLIDNVSFHVPECSLLGVIGPSGAPRSTLLSVLAGTLSPAVGNVLYDNRDLYRNYAELKHRIGFIPQEGSLQKSILRTRQTVRGALEYYAKRHFPADTSLAERKYCVESVLGEVGVTRYGDTRLDRLSSEQLKLINIAQELLTSPSLLFLDKPTSGTDPGLDTRMMTELRNLAHDGRVVVVVTNSVDAIDKCDRLLVLTPGGRVGFYGPPAEGLGYFGQTQWGEVFEEFKRNPGADWAARFTKSPAHMQYTKRAT